MIKCTVRIYMYDIVYSWQSFSRVPNANGCLRRSEPVVFDILYNGWAYLWGKPLTKAVQCKSFRRFLKIKDLSQFSKAWWNLKSGNSILVSATIVGVYSDTRHSRKFYTTSKTTGSVSGLFIFFSDLCKNLQPPWFSLARLQSRKNPLSLGTE